MRTTAYWWNGSLVALVFFGLAACGGGGGNPAPAPAPQAARVALTSANYETATIEAAASGFSLANNASLNSLLIGVGASAAPRWTALGMQQFNKLPELFRLNSNHLVGASLVQTVACSQGGSATLTLSDNNGNGIADAGDRATFVFSNCIESAGTITGTLTLAVNTQSGAIGSYPFTVDVTMTFQALRVAVGTVVATADGNIRVASSRTGFQLGTDSISSTSFAVAATVAGTTYSRSISDYIAAVTYGASATSSTLQGVIGSSALGNANVSIKTTRPFLQFYTDPYPYDGVLVVSGANNGTATLTTLNNTQVSIALDANGDGTPEFTVTKLWSAIQ
jgi:hypothetical protein